MRHSLALAALLLSLAGHARAGAVYCCQDAGGQQVCGDPLPTQCYGREYRELGSRGVTLRRSSAPMDPQEAARRQLAERLEKRDAVEQQRRDHALLQTYSSEDEIRLLYERRRRDAEDALARVTQQVEEARARQEKLEAEARGRKPLPPRVEESLRANEAELRRLESLKGGRQADLAGV